MSKTPSTTPKKTAANVLEMLPKMDIRLVGTIRALAPIHISRKDDEDPNLKGCPTIIRTTSGGREMLPFIGGETIKGLLRAAAGDIVTHASGESLILSDYYKLFKGGIKGGDSEGPADIKATIGLRQSNPVFGLFGMAAPRWLGSSIEVGAAVPESESDAAIHRTSGARRDDFKLSPERMAMLADTSVEEYAEARDMEKKRSALKARLASIKQEIAKISVKQKKEEVPGGNERKAELRAEDEAIKKQLEDMKGEDNSNTVGRPLSLQAIAMGSTFQHRIVGFRSTHQEVGLLLESLRHIRNQCRIGGKKSTGYGAFEAQWSIGVRTDPFADYEHGGHIVLSPDHFELTSPHALVTQALDAWKALAKDGQKLNIGTLDLAA
jgi:CRISPR type IV-associated protein Csf2